VLLSGPPPLCFADRSVARVDSVPTRTYFSTVFGKKRWRKYRDCNQPHHYSASAAAPFPQFGGGSVGPHRADRPPAQQRWWTSYSATTPLDGHTSMESWMHATQATPSNKRRVRRCSDLFRRRTPPWVGRPPSPPPRRSITQHRLVRVKKGRHIPRLGSLGPCRLSRVFTARIRLGLHGGPWSTHVGTRKKGGGLGERAKRSGARKKTAGPGSFSFGYPPSAPACSGRPRPSGWVRFAFAFSRLYIRG
jgi:hypothetical protein